MSKLEDRFEEQLRRLHVEGGMVRELVFAPPRRWRFDFAWPALMVALEVDGGEFVQGRHNRGLEMANDAEKIAAANLAGWTVYRATGRMVRNGRAAQIIYRALQHAGAVERAKVERANATTLEGTP